MSHAQHVAAAVSVNPHDNMVIASYAFSAPEAVDAALQRAHDAQRGWARAGLEQRGAFLRELAGRLRREQDDLAELITAEMGKPIREARAEVEKSAWACEYYAEHGAEHLAPEPVTTEWSASYVQFPPLGVVLAVMPWNFPVWQVVRAAAPALMAGNTMVLKHASNVTGTALRLGEIFAGVCPALLEIVVIESADVAQVIADPRIAAVTLTGSEAAGIQVATTCAQHLKPSVLELGGSDPFIVLEDADIEAAANMAVTARFANTGQSCVAAKRFIVVDAVAPAFEEAFAAATAALVVGDPRGAVDVGPLARMDLRDELAHQVRRGVEAGGRVIVGGVEHDGPGAYYAPTVIGSVTSDNPLASEETFGPAAAVLRAADEAEAIALANSTEYGLAGIVYTGSAGRAERVGRAIRGGTVWVNAFLVRDLTAPFGGVGISGIGREGGDYALDFYSDLKTLQILEGTTS
jgi:succinate-semialdehyde dehydrogenase / glutarate-semialdehyde dehydrogenase